MRVFCLLSYLKLLVTDYSRSTRNEFSIARSASSPDSHGTNCEERYSSGCHPVEQDRNYQKAKLNFLKVS